VLVEVMIAVLQGVSQAVAERLMRGRGSRAQLGEVITEVARMRAVQSRDHETLEQLMVVMVRVLQRADGLVIEDDSVVFVPTAGTPTVESALVNLDREITRLREETPMVVEGTVESAPATSALDGLDEEIAAMRREGSGR
jgi:hypothetical protein